MTHTRIWPGGISQGTRLLSSKMDVLDDTLSVTLREGTNTLDDNVTVDLNTNTVDFDGGDMLLPAGVTIHGNSTASTITFENARTVTDFCPSSVPLYVEADWKRAAVGSWPNVYGRWESQDATNIRPIIFMLQALPLGFAVTSVKMVIAGTASGDPVTGTMPKISFGYTTPGAATTYTNIGNQADTTTVQATYNGLHTVTASFSAHTIAAQRQYFIAVNNAYGGNHTTGLQLYGVWMTGTLTTLSPAGAL